MEAVSGANPGEDGRAAVYIGIETSGVQYPAVNRTVLPGTGIDVLKYVTKWELRGGKDSQSETLLAEFSDSGATVSLEPGTWNFTVKGYNANNDLVLRGELTGQPVTLDGPNVLSFTVAPVIEGYGTLKLTVNLPSGHGITRAEVFKEGTPVSDVTPEADTVVFESEYAAGDYYISVRLYKDSDLYAVVSDLVQVRGHLHSEKTYTLTLADLNRTYLVTYHLNNGDLGGGVNNPGSYRSTDAALTLPTPVRTGYAFEGWRDNADLSGDAVTRIDQGGTGDRDFWAKWTAISYNISYTLNGGRNADGNPAAYTVEALPVNLENPSHTTEGYTFAGWYDNADLSGNTVAGIPEGETESKHFYAKWITNAYSITYHLNGGLNADSNPAAYTVADLPFALKTPGKTGYTFADWYDNAGLTGTAVSHILAGSTEDKVFYAKWTPITYTVEYYNSYGDTGTTDSSVHTYDEPKNLTDNGFTRVGYTFVGWSTTLDGGVIYTDGETVTNLSNTQGLTLTLYAQWTANTYTVEYNGNGYTGGETQSSVLTYDKPKQLTANGFTRTGYTFAGWNTAANGSGTSYINSASIRNLTDTQGATITFYAQWKPIIYTVRYYNNYNSYSGTGNTDPSAHTYDEPKNLTANGFTRTGYTFACWSTAYDGTGTRYTNGESVINLATTNGATVNLYAQWALNSSQPITLTINDFVDRADGVITHAPFILSKSSNPSKTITVSGGGGTDITWYIGVVQIGTGSSITISPANLPVGSHTLGVTALYSGKRYSKEITFTVQQ
jgi:uncharacterized repeat protein (TIGR02543 family)